MRLDSVDGSFVELTVTGYQFPHLARDSDSRVSDDVNWLMVHGQVGDGSRWWDFHEPCMTAGEARGLARWLRGICTGEAEPQFDFIEPNLRFELAGQTPQ